MRCENVKLNKVNSADTYSQYKIAMNKSTKKYKILKELLNHGNIKL
jgi:hypothetical protein